MNSSSSPIETWTDTAAVKAGWYITAKKANGTQPDRSISPCQRVHSWKVRAGDRKHRSIYGTECAWLKHARAINCDVVQPHMCCHLGVDGTPLKALTVHAAAHNITTLPGPARDHLHKQLGVSVTSCLMCQIDLVGMDAVVRTKWLTTLRIMVLRF